jgi:ethanolamine ammonia-lyase small subunit
MTQLPARPDAWQSLRRFTSARIAIGSSGNSVTTAQLLQFGVAHAQARDAVHLPLDVETLQTQLASHGFDGVELESAAPDRASYLRRPDLGRILSTRSAEVVERAASSAGLGEPDLLIVVGDGLSAAAVHRNAVALLLALRPLLDNAGIAPGPVVIARQARVAFGDPVGEAWRARLVLMLIGERPGLSSPDSLGAYLTWAPRSGCADSARNCVSNIRPEGLAIADAARKLAWLIGESLRIGATGIALKDGSDQASLSDAGPAGQRLPGAG